ncbi:hypothetical protein YASMINEVIRUS_1454 [Yasminevirus sp. GU-2018]|uniref:Transmembrane protein n=1 Tax=Yasminevirus sp. GU-2018 TaxID=2420051 RepID=A0A5K0UBC2_9VIRU|nr:hypothetical protein YASMINEVIRUS_1454 [Yasminevirus sp. GU-2018]
MSDYNERAVIVGTDHDAPPNYNATFKEIPSGSGSPTSSDFRNEKIGGDQPTVNNGDVVRTPTSESRDCFGEDGVIDTFFSMACFPFKFFGVELYKLLFSENWFYNTILYSYSNEGAPLIFGSIDKLTCDTRKSNHDCCFCCCCCMPISLYMIVMGVLLWIVDVILAVFQLCFGVIMFFLSILVSIFFKTEGLHPCMISLLHIWRAVARTTFVLAIIDSSCGNSKRNIERTGATVYIRKTWEDYVKTAHFSNIFSVSSFVNKDENLAHILLCVPFINIAVGAIKVVIGLLTLPFTLLTTCVIETESFSWAEWSGVHILHGVLGMTIIGYPIYVCANGDTTQQNSIRKRALASLDPAVVQTLSPADIDKMITSYSWKFRTIDDFCRFFGTLFKQLNPYSMNYLYEVDGEMNVMDVMATLPVIGFIPFILRVPAVFVWLTFGCCHTLWRKRINRPSYFKIFGFYVLTGLLAGSVIFTWVNYVIYRRRLEVVPLNMRVSTQVLPTHV